MESFLLEVVHPGAQLDAGLEVDDAALAKGNLLAGLGIVGDAGLPDADLESKLPNPRISMRSPTASVSIISSKISLTALSMSCGLV